MEAQFALLLAELEAGVTVVTGYLIDAAPVVIGIIAFVGVAGWVFRKLSNLAQGI